MKKLIFGLCCAALVSPLLAQDRTGTAPAPATVIQTVSHRACDTACPQTCCPDKVCVSEPTTKKTTKVVYSSKCIEYCLPKCSLGRGGCDCAENCGPVRTKTVQLKRVVTEECPDTHCVVRPAGCATMPPAAEKTAAPLPKGSGKE